MLRKLLVFVIFTFFACATAVEHVPADAPTVIAFVNTSNMSQEERDTVVDDFQYYLAANRDVTRELGARFILIQNRSFRVADRVIDTAHAHPVGFLLVTPRKEQLLLTGVQTDVDFACAVAAYFGVKTTRCPAG